MPIFQAGSASVPIVPDFKGAQKAISEWFASQGDLKIGVKADVKDSDYLAAKAKLDTLSGTATVHIDQNRFESDLRTAMTDAFKGAVGLFDFASVLDKTILPAAKIGLVGLATELGSTLSTVAAGSLALLPATILGLAAPLATIKIGVSGLSAAFKDLSSGNIAQLQKDMAKLAPAAQDFVTQVHSMGPAFTSLKLDVQQQLFQGLGSAIHQLGTVALPVMQTGFSNIASSLNSGLLLTIRQLLQDSGAFTDLFANINTAVHTVATGALPIMVQDFIQIADIGSQFLPQLATGFTNLVTKFDTFLQHSIQTGQFVQTIKEALSILTQLGTLLGNLAGIVGEIFKAALPFGVQFLGLLNQLTGGLKTLLGTTTAQNALSGFFSDITNAVRIVLPALQQLIGVILINVLPVIGQFLQALAPLAATLGVQLAGALEAVSKLLPPLAQVVAALISAFAPLIPVISQLVLTLLPPLLKVFNDLAPVISTLTAAFGKALLGAVQALVPFIQPLGEAFIKIVSALTPLLPALIPLAAAFGHLLGAVLPLVPILVSLVGVLVKIADVAVLPFLVGVINAFAAGLKVIIGFLGPFAPILLAIAAAIGIWSAAQWILNAALWANPIALLIGVIAALIIAIGLIVTHIQDFGHIWTIVWGAVRDFFVNIWNDVIGWIQTHIIGWFTNTFVPFFTQTIPNFWSNAWSAVRDFFLGIWNAITGFVQTHIIDWFTGTFIHFFVDTIPTAFKSAWTGIRDFFVNLWNDLVGWFHTVLSNFGTFFSNFWSGLQSGVASIWHGILHALEEPVQVVIDWVWNKTLRNAWNLLNNLWGGKDLPPITLPGFSAADGAVLPGFTPGRDVHHFVSPTGGLLNLSGGEAIMRPEFTAAVGAGWVGSMNAAARSGGVSGVRSALGFADGGVWPGQDWASGSNARGDRSTGWASGLLGNFGWLANLIPGDGALIAQLAKYLTADQAAGSNQGSSTWFDVLGGAVRTQTNHLWDFIKSSVTSWFTSTAASHPAPPAGGGPGGAAPTGVPAGRAGNEAAVKAVAARYGWDTGVQWDDLVAVISRESGFNNTAQNPTSTAYGMFQFLNSTWAGYPYPKTSDPGQQAVDGLAYIQRVYGTPAGAWAHEQNIGWYDTGGFLPPGWSTVFNGTGQHEMVLNPDQQASLGERLRRSDRRDSGSLIGAYHQHFHGDERANDAMDELWHRVKVASRGGVYTSASTYLLD